MNFLLPCDQCWCYLLPGGAAVGGVVEGGGAGVAGDGVAVLGVDEGGLRDVVGALGVEVEVERAG